MGNRNTHISVGLAGDCRLAAFPAAQMAALVKVAAWAVRNADMRITIDTVKGHQDYISTACPGWQYGWKGDFYAALRAELDIEPEPEPEPPSPGTNDWTPWPRQFLAGYHGQTWAPWMHEINAQVKMSSAKGLAGMQDGYSVLAANPDCAWIWRHHGSQHESTQAATPQEMARLWLDTFLDGASAVCDELERRGQVPTGNRPYFWVESWNEMQATGDPFLDTVVAGEVEMIKQIRQREPRLGLVVFNAPVGNPGEWEFVKLLPLAREAIKYDQFVAFGYHAYWAGDPQQSYQTREHWPYLQGRWDEIDKYFIANGCRVFWNLGECGVVGGHPVEGGGYWLNPGSGWLDPSDCYGGDLERYLADIAQFLQWCRDTKAGQEDRILGTAFFTSGDPRYTNWDWFQMPEYVWRAIAALA